MEEKTIGFSIEHVLKQKKKGLPNGHVYSVVNEKTEMHDICKIPLSVLKDIELGQFILDLVAQNKELNGVIKKQKKAILTNKDRIEKLEEIIKRYGLV